MHPDGFALPALRDTAQPLKHVAGRHYYTTQDRGHIDKTSGKMYCLTEDSFCLEGEKLFGLILWMYVPQRARGEQEVAYSIRQPPLLLLARPPSSPSYSPREVKS